MAGDSQERKGLATSACMMAPERDLGLNPPSSQRPNCQNLQEQTLHSWTLSPFAVTPSRLLEGQTEPVEGNEEDLMRPTSALTTSSCENEKRERAPIPNVLLMPPLQVKETSAPGEAWKATFYWRVLTFTLRRQRPRHHEGYPLIP